MYANNDPNHFKPKTFYNGTRYMTICHTVQGVNNYLMLKTSRIGIHGEMAVLSQDS
jgi:hypothetical protein